MTREEFLQALREALQGMKEEEIEGVLAYYAEMIDDSVEAGMTPQAAVNAMEPVNVIASRVLSESDGKDEHKLDDDEGIKVITRPADEVLELLVSSENQSVTLRTGEENTVTLRYRINPGDIYRLHENDGVLTLEHKRKPLSSFAFENGSINAENILARVGKFIENLDIHVFTGASQPDRCVEITLPRVFKGKLSASTNNGRIHTEGVTCLGKADLTTSNARITLSRFVANGVTACSSNGRIELNDVYCREAVRASTSNGRINAVKVSSDSELRLVTSNGRVDITGVSAPAISLHTSNGGINGTIKGVANEYDFEGETLSGSVVKIGGDNAEKRLDARTSNGSINIRFEP